MPKKVDQDLTSILGQLLEIDSGSMSQSDLSDSYNNVFNF